jgi:hypothetical protein
VSDALIVLVVAASVGLVGIGLGMLVVAPRLSRWAERGQDEDPDL